MDIQQIKKMLLRICLGYCVLTLLFRFAAGDGFRYAKAETESLSPGIVIGELTQDTQLQQQLTVAMDRLDRISVCAATYARQNTGTIHLKVTDSRGSMLSQASADISDAADGGYLAFELSPALEGYRDKAVSLSFTAEGCTAGNALAFYAGNAVATARLSVEKQLEDQELYRLDGQPGPGMLCMKTSGVDFLQFYRWYWVLAAAGFLLLVCACLKGCRAMEQGKNNLLTGGLQMLTRYRFLIKQLVIRDFKVKYKRSVLGVAWSFLNPLMTMLVQYVVFSTLFKSSIPNFPVYLLSGTVFFSFFNEAISMGMSSVIGNASLIKKVYVPKYIYPVARVLSSLVNFALAFAPLLLVMIFTGTAFRPSILLLIFDIACYLCFIMGMVLVLSAAVVFFQDVQFLWGVASMLWMYLTPIFYPETIIPARYLPFYRLNPLYQYVSFARCCIIDGSCPRPMAFLGCLLPAVAMLIIGGAVFKKQQDKFIMYV